MKLVILLLCIVFFPVIVITCGVSAWFSVIDQSFDMIDRRREIEALVRNGSDRQILAELASAKDLDDASPHLIIGPGGDYTRDTLFTE